MEADNRKPESVGSWGGSLLRADRSVGGGWLAVALEGRGQGGAPRSPVGPPGIQVERGKKGKPRRAVEQKGGCEGAP